MRALNEFEKELVMRLLHADNVAVPSLSAILDKRLLDVDLVRAQSHWEMHFDAAKFQEQILVDEVRTLVRHLVSAVHLLRELEANGLIILYQEAKPPSPARFGRLTQGNSPIIAEVHDPNVNRLLDETAFSSILVQPGLRDYVEGEFRMPEEIRADQDLRMSRRNLRLAAWALVASVLIGIWQVCLAYREVHYGRLQVEQTQQVAVDSLQLRSIMREMKEMKADSSTPQAAKDTSVHALPGPCCKH